MMRSARLSRLRRAVTPGEGLLLLLSRRHVPEEGSGASAFAQPSQDPLSLWRDKVPGLEASVRGRSVLDFGCGEGAQALALAKLGASRVFGLDTDPVGIRRANDARAQVSEDLQGRVSFGVSPPEGAGFDLVLSQNSMEHFPEPAKVLTVMRDLLVPGGELWISFGPPWWAPYGSHMSFFTPLPWVNLLFSEESVMRARSHYRNDGATRYGEVRNGLNQMSLARFESLLRDLGGKVRWLRYEGIRGADLLCYVPGVRELVTNHVSCIVSF